MSKCSWWLKWSSCANKEVSSRTCLPNLFCTCSRCFESTGQPHNSKPFKTSLNLPILSSHSLSAKLKLMQPNESTRQPRPIKQMTQLVNAFLSRTLYCVNWRQLKLSRWETNNRQSIKLSYLSEKLFRPKTFAPLLMLWRVSATKNSIKQWRWLLKNSELYKKVSKETFCFSLSRKLSLYKSKMQ